MRYKDMTLERLGFSGAEAALFAEIRMFMQGGVIIGGRAGDGKSTTLAVNLALRMAEMEGQLTRRGRDAPEQWCRHQDPRQGRKNTLGLCSDERCPQGHERLLAHQRGALRMSTAPVRADGPLGNSALEYLGTGGLSEGGEGPHLVCPRLFAVYL